MVTYIGHHPVYRSAFVLIIANYQLRRHLGSVLAVYPVQY